MKKVNGKLLLFVVSFMFGIFLINGCTHDDEIVILPENIYEYPLDKVSITDGFNFDKAHSSVRWETAYLGSSALLTGRFNAFEFTIEGFEADKPESTSITGKVTLSSVNTGEPGRDGGCLLGTFGTDVSDEATFVSTSVDKDGQGGYEIIGNLNFHGITSEVAGTLEYAGTTHFDENSGVNGAPLNVAGFIIRFQFNAISIFGLDTHNIGDAVTVIASGQFKQPL
ncbi:MAG: polyisoprenoid-binding protein YceI [Ulvibacter sp.]|jgi:polyisoprenoid-binding protein YceI